MRTRFLPSVSAAPRSLAAQLAVALEAAALAAPSGNASSLALVPHSVADALVAADFRAAAATRGASYALYVLNPAPPRSRPYAYSFPGRGQPCAATLWAARARYAWLDLSAGPVAYGPRSAREMRAGGVSPASFPRPAGAFARGAAGELRAPGADGVAAATAGGATSSREGRAQLAATLLGVVRAASQQLLAPPLAHAPVGLWRHTEVALLRVSDVLEDTRPNATSSSSAASGAVSGFDAEALRRELLAAQLGPATVSVTVRELSFGTCELCGVAFATALRSRAPDALPPPGAVNAGDNTPRERAVLDAAELARNLAALLPAMRRDGALRVEGTVPADESDAAGKPPGRSGAFVRGGDRRVLPIFLFDLSRPEALLLDGTETAVAFPDIAVAVRTRAGEAPLPHAACSSGAAALEDGQGGGGGGGVTAGGRELTRPLLAAALAAGWGVAPPWAAGGGGGEDWTWAAGHTPFGPLAAAEGLPFSARDAAQRHVALSAAAAARTAAAAALRRFASMPGAAEAMPRGAAAEVAGRAAALRHKQRRAAAALGAHQFDTAAYYARSAAHDAAGIEAALRRAAAATPTRLDCSGGAAGGTSVIRSAAAAAASAAVCGAAGWFVRRAAAGTRRRKQW